MPIKTLNRFLLFVALSLSLTSVILQLHLNTPSVVVVDLRERQTPQEYLKEMAVHFQVDPELASKIILCESGWKPHAKNPNSTASGLFQFIRSTWAGTPQGRAGLSPFDYKANIDAGLWMLSHEGGLAHWKETESCWK